MPSQNTEPPPTTVASLFLWQGCALYVGPVSDATEHRHHAAQLCLGLEQPFRLQTDGSWADVDFARIPAGQSHRYDGMRSPQVVVLLDAETAVGAHIHKRGLYKGGAPKERRPEIPADLDSARDFVDWMTEGLASKVQQPPTRDSRIRRALESIANIQGEQLSAGQLAGIACLSEDHFLHLFSREVGLPLRRYILWRRILTAVDVISEDGDLTTAALRGGFSDSSHFSRVFRSNFGLAPSTVLKNSRFIQVIADRAS